MTKTTEKVKINRDEGGLIRDATQSGIQVKVAYSPEDIAGYSQDEIGMPGCYPYTRGIYKNMYRDRLWLKSFIVSYATPEDTNAAFKSYIKQGLTDVRLLCDLPTQCGLDPDHPSSWNSMMCGGVASYAINTYEKMLDGMELENTQFELAHQNVSNFHYFHAVIVAMMENEGLNIAKLKGNGICDTVRAKLVYASPEWTTEINRRVSLDHIEYCLQDTPKWKAVVPNGVDICQAGMNAIHEIGTVLAGCIAIMEDLKSRDITVDDYGSMVVALDAESDLFENVAKFRAIRRMWAKIAKNRFGATSPKAMQMKIGIRTSGLSLQWQKPLNNAARVTLEVLSCVFGGCNSIDASSFDEAIGLPSAEARLFNLDMQHIITHEAGVPLVGDPLGGSYYVEWLTNKFEEETNKYLDEIEERGGAYEALDSGWLNSILEQDRLKVQREKAEGKRLIIGVNSFKNEVPDAPINKAILDCAYKVPTEQMRADMVEEVKAYKAGRNYEKLGKWFRQLYLDTKEGRNISRATIEGIKEGLTIGEYCGIVRLAYGMRYDPMEMLPTPDYIEAALKEIK